jgi:hypothetical protein
MRLTGKEVDLHFAVACVCNGLQHDNLLARRACHYFVSIGCKDRRIAMVSSSLLSTPSTQPEVTPRPCSPKEMRAADRTEPRVACFFFPSEYLPGVATPCWPAPSLRPQTAQPHVPASPRRRCGHKQTSPPHRPS